MACNKWVKLSNALFQLYLVIVLLFGYIHCEENCVPGLETHGYTLPRGDILIEYGNPLDITCVLNDNYVKTHGSDLSRNLYFNSSREEVPKEMIEILDTRSIKLHIDNPPKSDSMYTCGLRNENGVVCLNNVVVGTKPQPVDDFECIGYNYENLTCTWTAPENYAKTNYTLTYYFPGRASRSLINSCPEIVQEKNKMSCFWSVFTRPQYRQPQRTYYFMLTMTNGLGTTQINKTFSHFQHVLSGPPENLTVVNTTTESIYLRWSVPNSMQTFPPGLQHRVLYQSELDAKQWKFGGLLSAQQTKERKVVYFNLTGLKYAHMLYDVRVSLRSSVALPDDESMWSKNASITVRTKSKEPSAPPLTNVGSFEIVSSGNNLMYRDVYIYWQQVPQEIQNGEGFTYEVKNIDAPGDGQLVEQKNAYAKFKDLSVEKSYRFLIWSKNHVGRSENYSSITIPDILYNKVKEPFAFTKVAFGDGKYELSWEAPKNAEPIVNYTIFWCTHDRDRPFQCTGYLDWMIIPSNITVFNITVPDAKVHPRIHQFAISANTRFSSSGMVWAACTVIPNTSIGKMKNVWINKIGSDYIDVGWKLDCSDRIGSVEGFVINYCPIVSPTERNCKGSQRNITFYGSADLIQGSVRGLKPYTTYMLTVAVITKHNSLSQQSDALLNTTLEAAPSMPPRNVRISDITNTSFMVSWEPPQDMNGILKYYEIHYNNNSITVDRKHETKYMLSNLTSYEYYDISVVACTVSCSPPSPVQRIRTDVGFPGKIQQPSVIFQNDSYIVVNWKKPLQPRGENDVYQVQFKEKLEYENKTQPIINVTGTRYSIESCGDDGKYNTFYISVRAVNIINGTAYPGPWSDELESYCRTPPKILVWILTPFGIIVLVALFYTVKKLYSSCQKMRDVEVKLPPGLAPVVTADIGRNHWGSPKGQEENSIHHPPADEELLLEKLSDRNLTGDSSGCSSGHESVISSLDPVTRVPSPTDSGTEQPHSSSTEEVNKNSLRLRKGYISMPESASGTPWPSKTNVSGNSYCVLGVDPHPTVDTSPAYVPVAIPQIELNKPPSAISTPTTHTPYVLTSDINKTSNHGYVPLAGSEVADKNFTYVMAGSKPSATPELVRLNSSSSTSSEDKLMYVQVADTPNAVIKPLSESNTWHQPVYDSSINKLGYVSIGDAVPPHMTHDMKSGYYSHKNFDSKCLKED